MRFTKMHGAGNDFIIINNTEEKIPAEKLPEVVKKLCTPHTSLGADGFMVVDKAQGDADYSMLFFNADGSIGEMCGNGARCIARYGYENGLAGETQRIETTAGLVTGYRLSERLYQVQLNDPSTIDLHRKACAKGQEYDCAYVELGNPGLPHALVLMPEWDAMDTNELREIGRELRFSPSFPRGANVTFAKLIGEDHLKAVTFERGVEDFTLACGTGCGSLITSFTLLGRVSGKDVAIDMPGGQLRVTVNVCGEKVDHVMLTGPTNIVAKGEILDEDLCL